MPSCKDSLPILRHHLIIIIINIIIIIILFAIWFLVVLLYFLFLPLSFHIFCINVILFLQCLPAVGF
jgi:hypothetical protein